MRVPRTFTLVPILVGLAVPGRPEFEKKKSHLRRCLAQMIIRRILQVGLLSFAATALALPAQAARFIDASLKGSYSFMVNRWTTDSSSAQYAMVGVMIFDGAGNVSGTGTAVYDGVVCSGALGATYTVNPNGTGTMSITTSPVGPAQLAIVLHSTSAGIAQGVKFLQTDDPTNEVNSGAFVLQSTSPPAFSVASLNGRFALQVTDSSADPAFNDQGGPAFNDQGGTGLVTLTARGTSTVP